MGLWVYVVYKMYQDQTTLFVRIASVMRYMSTVVHIFHASKVKVQPYVVLRIRDLAPSTPDKASSESCGELSATNKSASGWL